MQTEPTCDLTEEWDEDFAREVDAIMRDVCRRLCLPVNLDDDTLAQALMDQSRRYHVCPVPFPCEAVAAENLYFRRKLIGITQEQVAQATGIPLPIVQAYEDGIRSIDGHQEEFLRIAGCYQYHITTLRDVFLYGSAFHELFNGPTSWPDKSTLTMCDNPFFSA